MRRGRKKGQKGGKAARFVKKRKKKLDD